MTDDDLFRVILLVLTAAFMPIGFYHRLRAHTGEKLDRWQEGLLILFGLRLTGLVVFVAGVTWMIDPDLMRWSALPLPPWLRWVGVVLFACGGTLFVWSMHNLGPNLTDTVVTRIKHTLVTTGPYNYIRHPFYTSAIIGFIGVSLAMANWFILLAGAVGMSFLIARIPIEEQKLIARFGDDYRAYTATHGRFFPRIG